MNLSLGGTPAPAAPNAVITISGTPITSATADAVYPGFTLHVYGGTAPKVFSVHSGTLPTGLSLNSSTGAVTGTPTVPGTTDLIVMRVTDTNGLYADLSPFQIAVATSLTISGVPVTTGTLGVAYAGFTVTASGGTEPYVFSVAAGILPQGLTLDPSSGDIAGTPTLVQTETGIVIRVTDGAGYHADLAPFTLTIGETLIISGTPVTTGTVDTPYTGFTVAGSGGTEPYVYSVHAGTLPTGITLDADTGDVAGTPTVEETQTGIVLRVTDAIAHTADLAPFQIAVSAASGYTCGGVVFDGATSLINAALACTENGKISFAGWVWYPDWSFPVVYCSDPDNNDANNVEGTGTQGVYNFNTYSGDSSTFIRLNNTTIPLTLSGWHWVAGAADISGSPVAHLFIDAVESSDTITSGGTGSTLGINGLPFGVGYDFGAFTDGYMAELWIAPGQYLDFSSPAVVAKFFAAGNPVDLGADGSTPTGTAPAIFLSIPAAGMPADFATNLGTGGAFSLNAGVTQTGALVDTSADVVMSDVTGITAGAFITVTGVPAGTTVLSINTLTVTMSAPATASNAAASIKFGGVLRLAPSSPSD